MRHGRHERARTATADGRRRPTTEGVGPHIRASPTPGQVVMVQDTLPDPPYGEGRYYITAWQHGADRRLGRQYVNGAFSARDPSTLPVCQ